MIGYVSCGRVADVAENRNGSRVLVVADSLRPALRYVHVMLKTGL